MVTFILVVFGLIVLCLSFKISSLRDTIAELNADVSMYRNRTNGAIDNIQIQLSKTQQVNADVFETISKEFKKDWKKIRVIENAGERNEKIVTKFELVDLPKVKKTK